VAVNKRKILDAARKYAQRGAQQKALKEYTTALRVDPCDARLRLEIGDAHRRWGEPEQAITHYVRVAEQYCEEGFEARAVAVYKQILNLAPKRFETHVSLAEVYQRMGLEAEAIGALQAAADGYHAEGNEAEVLEMLRRIAQLDPANTASRLRVAEMLVAAGRELDAVVEYRAVAEELTSRRELEPVAGVLDRALALAEDDVELLILRATHARDVESPEEAFEWVRRALRAEESEAGLLLLVDLCRELDDAESLADVTRRLARCYRDRGDEDAAREIMQRLPGGATVGEGLGDSSDLPAVLLGEPASLEASQDADGECQGVSARSLTDSFLADEAEPEDGPLDAFVPDGDAGPGPVAMPGAAELTVELGEETLSSPSPTAVTSEAPDPEQLLADATVYLRYGKVDHAIESARRLLGDEPGHRAGLDCLGQALAAGGDDEAAVTVWLEACERAREEDAFEHFEDLLARVAAVDGERAAAVSPLVRPPLASSTEASETFPGGALRGVDDASLVAADGATSFEFEICDEDIERAADPVLDPASRTAPAAGGETSVLAARVREQLEEAEFFFEQGLREEAAALYQDVLAVAPNHPSALVRLGEIENGMPAPSARPSSLESLRSSSLTGVQVEVSEPLNGGVDRGQSDALVTNGALEKLGRDAERMRLAELEGVSFEDLFKSFKEGVTETLAEGDTETRYDLAIAYKEMGLLEDAIASFEACIGCPNRGLDSLQLLAQCSIEVGRPSDAISHLEQALSSGGLEVQRRAGLYFDLARACADAGDLDRARTTYETVSDLVPSFPGLSAAIDALLCQSRAVRDEVDMPALEPDEGGDAFERLDDLVAEVTARDALVGVLGDVERPEQPDGPMGASTAGEFEPEAGASGARERPKKRRKKITFV
jgi:tetratricopeptide (TPR) repeat protein